MACTTATQTGLLQPQNNAAIAPLGGVRCLVTLSVGREPGTWMPKEWAASGARLSLPMSVSFTEEPVDLGFPGEETLGGRTARRLNCEGGSFVGPRGEVTVNADGGAWSTLPTGREGEYILRFFVDFPDEATRNDVTLPKGRVYFSGVCWDERGADIIRDAPPGVGVLAASPLAQRPTRQLEGRLTGQGCSLRARPDLHVVRVSRVAPRPKAVHTKQAPRGLQLTPFCGEQVCLWLRLPRLLRLLRVGRLLERFQDMYSLNTALVQLLKVCMLMLVLQHFFACAWYAVGVYEASRDATSCPSSLLNPSLQVLGP